MSPYLSPLRYPGGKTKLVPYINALFERNGLDGAEYAEPFAGGASVALDLVLKGRASRAHINDIDPSVWSFWHSVLNHADEICDQVLSASVNMETWHAQKEIQATRTQASTLELGFSTLFLNRTNRSGVLRAGVIGGKNQTGNYKIDARFNRQNLVDRIQAVYKVRDQIQLHNLDALDFLQKVVPSLPKRTLVYLDPPYYVKGGDLYEHHYSHDDHVTIADAVSEMERPWVVSYDDVEAIRALYKEQYHFSYTLNYTAQSRYRGSEVLFLSSDLNCPGLRGSMHSLAEG